MLPPKNVDRILSNYEEYWPFIIRGHYRSILTDCDNISMSVEEYRAHMLNPYSYGTFVELSVAAVLFERRIYVCFRGERSLC